MLQSLCLHFVCLLRCLGDVAVIYSFFLVYFIFDILFLVLFSISHNTGVNRAEKNISLHSLYINEVTDCLKPAGISLASIHQLLKNIANRCVCSIAFVSKIICMILKIDQYLLLTFQTSFVYLLR